MKISIFNSKYYSQPVDTRANLDNFHFVSSFSLVQSVNCEIIGNWVRGTTDPSSV